MSKKKKKNEVKKEKVIYYDDNSTIADMSGLPQNRKRNASAPQKEYAGRSTFKEKWKTYWNAVKMMVVPMCVVLIIISLLYFLILFVTQAAQ